MAMGDSAADKHEEVVISNKINPIRKELRQWETRDINPLLGGELQQCDEQR